FILAYNRPVVKSHYTEKEYPLVTDADFYVATDGDDNNPGTFDAPFATWNRAIEAVRGVEKTAEKGQITVAFKAGRYTSTHVEFTAEDAGTPECPVIYCKYGDGDVTFDNGVTIPAEDFAPLGESERSLFKDEAADKIFKIDLNRYIDEIPEFSEFALFSGDSLCSVARFPNKYLDGTDHFFYSGRTYSPTALLMEHQVITRKLASYPAEIIPEIRIFGWIIRGYRKDMFQVGSYDPETKVMEIADYESSEFHEMREGWAGVTGQGIEMCLLNIPFELDANGEYWVDRSTGTLYVFEPNGDYNIPGAAGPKELRGDPYDAGDGLPPVPEYVMIDARNTGYITLLGLDFRNVIGGFLFAYKTSGVTIDGCTFAYSTGRNHALIQYSTDDAPMDLTIQDCEFDFSVGCGVYVMDVATGPERYTNISNIKVDNCLFSRTNLDYDVEGACNLFKCTKGVISHCDFVECHRYGVMLDYSCDLIVEYNNFDSAMTNSEDGGVIRSALGMDANSIVRYNLINAVPGGSVGRFAQYSDLGDCGTTDMNNLFYDAGSIMVAGGGRDNNAVDNFFILHSGVEYSSNVPEILAEGEAAKSVWPISMWLSFWNSIRNYCDTVPGYKEELEARRPGASTFHFDFLHPEDENFVFAPVAVANGNVFINDDKNIKISSQSPEFTTLEDNEAYGLDENPFFVNPTIGDYRIKEGADCPDFPFEEIGRY
ncbi:MAG: right-handed parallel beta-helix repeat-containing protein, partial [Clostridia bacterium]|nr:right-handed parallel beta-helix repeat-containing protein [Clostridia bacterium]